MIPSVLIHHLSGPFFLAIMTAVMLFLIGPAFAAKAAGENHPACYRTFAKADLFCPSAFCPGNYYAGGSVSFRLAPGHKEFTLIGQSPSWMSITVSDREFSVVALPESFYTGYRHLTLGPTDYWIISEYTGSMHCCTRFHFFSRPAPGKTVIYLGVTAGSDESSGEQPLSCRESSLYLEDRDGRFLYFHTPYAESLLSFPRHYQITPFTLSVDNKSFRDQYLQRVKETEVDIEKILAKRPSGAASILLGRDADAVFSDLLGQLLVKRTILYLYAGETTTAWKKLEEDIRKYYINDDGLAQLQTEITQILAESPY